MEQLVPHRGEEFAELRAIGDIALFFRVLDEFFQNHLILRRQPMAPGVRAEDLLLFFENQNRQRESEPLGVVVGFSAKRLRFRKGVQEA